MNNRKILSILTIFSALTIFYSFSIKENSNKQDDPEITKDEIYNHIKYLSSDDLEGRFPGSKGDSLTQNYIIKEFKKYNLTPAGENGYLQPFEMVTHMEIKGNNEFQIISDNIATSFKVDSDFMPLGFSEKGKIEGELIFMGYGISAPEQNYDDYKDKNGNDIDIKGKILVMMRYSPGENEPHNNPFEKYEPARYKTLSARDGQAAGIIFITGPQSGEDVLMNLKFDNVLQNAGLPIINCKREIIEKIFTENNLDLNLIQKEIDSFKVSNSFALNNSMAIIETDVEPVRVTTNNEIGFIEGNDPVLKNEVIVIGAHKDHLGYGLYGSLYRGNDKQIHNGADDNASGIAGVIEI
ncbi:MAG: M28 family peptidase, partial [Ignavibacteria bacterium]|nr:M28 family peptidase [Ignavibacteria bacterium]